MVVTGPQAIPRPCSSEQHVGRQPHHIVEVVGHEDHRHVERPPQRGDLLLKTPPYVAIDGGEWLVEQQHRRLPGQRPREGHPLALPPGELLRPPLRLLFQPDRAEELPRAPGPVGARQMPERGRDVPLGGEVRKERVFLEHEPGGALMRRHEGAGRSVGPRGAVRLDRRAVGLIKPGNRSQDRGLAAARRAEDGEHLAGAAAERDVERDWTGLFQADRQAALRHAAHQPGATTPSWP